LVKVKTPMGYHLSWGTEFATFDRPPLYSQWVC